MPFAHMQGAIPLPLEHLGHGDFRTRQAHGFIGDEIFFTFSVIDGIVELIGPFVMPNHFHELLGGGRELKAKTCGVTSRHHGGTRRRTRGITRIAGFEVGTLLRQTVDVGCGHGALGQTTAIQSDVVVAQVVSHNQNDVGWFATLT